MHIEGDVVQSGDNIALTVRGDDVPAKEFNGRTTEIGKLATRAAEYIYGRSQPLLYAIYLQDNGRFEFALAFIPSAFVRVPNEQRAQLAHQWALGFDSMNKSDEFFSKENLAMTLAEPHSAIWWQAWNGKLLAAANNEEERWRAASTMLGAVASSWSWERPDLSTLPKDYDFVWDFAMRLKAHLANAKINGGAGIRQDIAGPDAAIALSACTISRRQSNICPQATRMIILPRP